MCGSELTLVTEAELVAVYQAKVPVAPTAPAAKTKAETANVTAISGQTGSEEFDITVVPGLITNYNAVYLTNDSGQTKIISGGQNAVITPTGGAAYATVGAATLKVEYTGASATTAAGVLSFWKSALTTSIWVKATDTTTYNAGAGFATVAGDDNDMIEVAAANKGLKF